MWNVWSGGAKLNLNPLNENQARSMAFLHRLNYKSNAKAIKGNEQKK
jgi:hypothetical protein